MKFKLNGRTREAADGETVLEAARSAGIEIPAVCAHPLLEPYGACRLCMVEVKEKGRDRWRIVASCLFPVSEGLEVRTETEQIRRYRKSLLELLLARCPNEPFVRTLARRYGVRRTRFAAGDDDCILCGLCVRVCSEVVGADAIGFGWRGITRRVDIPFGIDSSRCIACGACTYLCPTGAIQMEYERVLELRRQHGEHRCRYALMGLIPDAVCPLNYECARCEVDQRMYAEFGTHPLLGLQERGDRTRAVGREGSPGRKANRGRRGKAPAAGRSRGRRRT